MMDDNEPFSSSPASYSSSAICPYELFFQALSLIPVRHYIFALLLAWIIFFYHFLEFHFFEDVFFGFFCGRVNLVYNPDSPVYHGVVARCRTLHGRYVATPWLSSPHIQTCFLNFHGMPPVFKYSRQLFRTSDGGTMALDWLTSSDVDRAVFKYSAIAKDDKTPIVVVLPGLSSDSSSAYLKHLAFNMAKSGWHVVVSNHRGLGGVSLTSDCFYNAGWTEDIRVVIDYLHRKYPMAPLFAVGTSIGANIVVKYLGEEGEKTPVAGAVAICSPWDLLIGDRFICRRLIQKLYDRALTIGLQGYAKLHEPLYARLANWEGIKKSRSIRDFDNHATCHVGKFETVDTYYRRCSSSQYVGNASVPLLCVSAMDDPLCTKEAIPWDECRANKNIVLATTKHGGHLAFFEGLTGTSLWWVRATNEFLSILLYSRCMHIQKEIQETVSESPKEPSIDQGPYLNFAEDGLVAAVGNGQDTDAMPEETDQSSNQMEARPKERFAMVENSRQHAVSSDTTATMTKSFDQLCRLSRRSIWLLGYIAIITTFSFLGSVLNNVFRKKQRSATRP